MLDRTRELIGATLIAFAMLAFAEVPLPDPTRPDLSSDAPAPRGASFKVTAIFYSNDRQQAVVNGKVVTQGDQIDGAKVMRIRPDALDLLYRGESITRRLPSLALRKE